MIYIDSCLIIFLVEGDQALASMVQKAMDCASDTRFAISPLVELECFVKPLKIGDRRREREYRALLSGFANLPVTRTTFHDAAVIRAHHGLKTPDALHLAIAQQSHCSALWTYDNRFAKAAPGFAITL